MPVTKGDRFGSYEILAPIGAGGMGEVYRARDVRLDRVVAMKFLPPHLNSNPVLRERFQREARAISALNHPHICALYDIGSEHGADFLVMEHCEGETLADRVQRGALPISQVVKIGAQIAAALEKAHAQGIVHRDLKPSNVMLTPSGAKLLDFGLAKLQEPVAPHDAPTIVGAKGPLTAEGSVLGTLNYMPPEQLEGRAVDARSDIFALGLLLYEMTTGRRAFDGTSRHTTMIAILEADPAPISTIRDVPPIVEQIIARCLSKNPDERWQSAHDVRMLLETSESGTPLMRAAKRSARLPWIVAAAALAIALGALVWALRRPREEPIGATFMIPAPPNTKVLARAQEILFSVSPDGRNLAISALSSGTRQIWIRPLDSLEARPLAGTEGAFDPFWSPDGTKVGFKTDDQLKWVAVNGGPVQVLGNDHGDASWSRESGILFEDNGGLALIDPAGGNGRRTIVPGHNADLYDWPCFLPDGKHFLVQHGRSSASKLESCDLQMQCKTIMPVQSRVVYAAGKIYFVRDGALLAQAFDPSTSRTSGDPVALANPVSYLAHATNAAFTVSADGRVVVYQNGSAPSRIVWRDRNGHELGSIGEPADYGNVRISPDGRRVATTITETKTGGGDVWLADIDRGVWSRFTTTNYSHSAPAWSGDSRALAFAADRVGAPDVYLKALGSVNDFDKMLVKGDAIAAPADIAASGAMLFMKGYPNPAHIWLMRPGAAAERIDATTAGERDGRFSPDGQWIAYTSASSGTDEVYVMRNDQSHEATRISTSGGHEPVWRRDGKELYYLDPQGQLTAVSVDGDRFGQPVVCSSASRPASGTRGSIR